MYEFIQTEGGWFVHWGPPPVQAKRKGPWQQIKASLGRSAAAEIHTRVQFTQREQSASPMAELTPTRT